MDTILQDLRYAFRTLWKGPGFALVIILTLGFGIGANTAIFSVVHAILLRPRPYPNSERLVEAGEAVQGLTAPVSWINFQYWRSENRTFDDMAGFETADLTLTGRGDALLTHAGVVDASFFHLTGSRPLLGRLFTQTDDRRGAAPTVLITYAFWAKALGANPAVLGTTLDLDGKAHQIIGVLPPGLRFFTRPVDYYLPLGPREGNAVNRADHGSMLIVGLLKSGVTRAAARTDLDAIMRRLAVADPGPESDHRASIWWLAEADTAEIRQPLILLMAAVILVLLIACANVANLLLARSTARVREMAIRSAMGAARSRVARQLLTENLAFAAIGGSFGVLLAGACLRALVLAGPRDIPRLWEVSLNLPVLLFTAAVTMLVGLLAALAPVVTAGRVDLTTALKEGSRGAGASRQGNALRGALVIAEIGITVVLSFASGLLLRSLYLAQNSYPGLNANGVLALELQLPPSRHKSDEAVRLFYTRLTEDLRRQPGVVDVGAVNCPPSIGGCAEGWYSIADQPAPPRADLPRTLLTTVDSGYFRTMEIPLLAGRPEGGTGAAVINEKIARRWWRSPQLAIGHPIKLGGPYMDGPVLNVVGVVGNVTQASLDTAPFSEIYVPFAQNTSSAMVVMIRTAGDPARWIPTVRHELASIDRGVPIQSLRPFEQWYGATLEQRRFSTLLLGIFAALAIALAAVGIYGVLNHWVGVRQKEIAIRMALGAERQTILCWAGGNALRLAATGVLLGIFGAWVASRWLQHLLFGVSAHSPAMLLSAGGGVIALAALAAGIPMWRAARIDPVRHLHDS